ncbi:MAG: hypothetical protein WD061_02445 [Candidatus Saccharimonadales bacterium]
MRWLVLSLLLILLSGCEDTIETEEGDMDTQDSPQASSDTPSPPSSDDIPDSTPDTEIATEPNADTGTEAKQSIAKVADPWSDGEIERGVHLYWPDNADDSRKIVAEKAVRILDYVVDMGANSITISFPIYMDNATANEVTVGPGTPTTSRLEEVLQQANRRELRITLRPLIDEQSLIGSGDWRGSIMPTKQAQWFESVETLYAPYLEVAEEYEVETFVLLAELNSLQQEERWSSVISAARDAFSGELSTSVNWDSYVAGNLGPEVDVLGLDAYFPMDIGDDATVNQLVDGWDHWLNQAEGHIDISSTLMHEVGIPAQNGAYRKPNDWGEGDQELNETVQERWFQSACSIVRLRKMKGIYYWKLDFHSDPKQTSTDENRTSFVGRPAEEVIKACFEELS